MNMSNRNRLVVALIISVLIVGLTACDQLLELLSDGDPDDLMDSEVPQFAGISGDIEVGLVLPLTGRLTESFGRAVATGLELAVEEINDGQMGDARIALITEDSQSTIEGAVQAYTKLIQEDSVSVILGPSTSGNDKRGISSRGTKPGCRHKRNLRPGAASAHLAIMSFASRSPQMWLVPNGINVTREKLNLQRVATLYDTADDFSVDSESALQEALTANGIEALAAETLESGDTDFSEQLTRIAALNPDAVFVFLLATGKSPHSDSSA